jgi:hypothetical protein
MENRWGLQFDQTHEVGARGGGEVEFALGNWAVGNLLNRADAEVHFVNRQGKACENNRSDRIQSSHHLGRLKDGTAQRKMLPFIPAIPGARGRTLPTNQSHASNVARASILFGYPFQWLMNQSQLFDKAQFSAVFSVLTGPVSHL